MEHFRPPAVWASAWLAWLDELQRISGRSCFAAIDPELVEIRRAFEAGRAPAEVAFRLDGRDLAA